VYVNDPSSHFVFIQYWLIKYNAPCPSASWSQFSSADRPTGCTLESLTGETNNLTLVAMSPIRIQPSPTIEFTESNIPGSVASCATAAGIGDTHLNTFSGLPLSFSGFAD